MLAYHGNPEIKDSAIAKMRDHREAERLLQGHGYWKHGKGCAVGCLVEGDNHALYETEFGIPEVIAHLEDAIFEGLPRDDAQAWPERFLAAIPVGADLSMVWPQFALWMLRDAGFLTITDENREAIQGVIALYVEWVETGEKPSQERFDAAQAAADAVACYVAWYAAGAASGAASGSAASDAANDAANDAAWAATSDASSDAAWFATLDATMRSMAAKLCELLAESPVSTEVVS